MSASKNRLWQSSHNNGRKYGFVYCNFQTQDSKSFEYNKEYFFRILYSFEKQIFIFVLAFISKRLEQ